MVRKEGEAFGRKARALVTELSKYQSTKERVKALEFTGNPSEERIHLATRFAMRVGRVLRGELEQVMYSHPKAPSVALPKLLPLYIEAVKNPAIMKALDASDKAVSSAPRVTTPGRRNVTQPGNDTPPYLVGSGVALDFSRTLTKT